MFSTPPSGGVVFVEALESRIAPTGLLAYAGDPTDTHATSDPHYITYQTAPTATSLGFVKAATLLGPSAPANLYAIKLTGNGTTDYNTLLSTGDELVVFNSVTGFNLSVPLIQANSGSVYAFFLDDPSKHGDGTRVAGQVYADELVGVSLGKKASVTINGNVYGDIATNLLNGGNTVSLTSVGKPSQQISGIQMTGNIYGDILAGGNIKNVKLVGTVNNVLAGTATNGVPFDFSGGTATPTGTIVDTARVGHHGANINQLTLNGVIPNGRIQAGDGGLTAVGGAVTNLQVTADTNSFSVLSGAGGDGTAGVLGGLGGVISQVIVHGTGDSTANVPILIEAGHGGNNAVGQGGTGGAAEGVAVGFDTYADSTNTGTMSTDLLAQNVTIIGGEGGSGIKGGNGGTVSNSQIAGSVPDDGVVGADGSANPEMQVLGGAGGVATVVGRGKGGHGGNVAQVTVQNFDVDPAAVTSSILVQGGLGGAAKGGGNVSNVDVLGTTFAINGGAGGNGINKGGGGGALSGIGVLSQVNLFAQNVTLNGGLGGDATAGPGGAGGSVDNVLVSDGDLVSLTINTGTHANGGRGADGLGGAGGAVTNVNITNDAISGVVGVVSIRTGQGGDGSTGGGVGGLGDTMQLIGTSFSYSVTAGAGGNALANGNGGAGGTLSNLGLANAPVQTTAVPDPTPLSGAVTAGAGGNGAGTNGIGGHGGDLAGVVARAVYNVSMTAGNAGDGASGEQTAGGINSAGALSLQGGVKVFSGTGSQANPANATIIDGGSIAGLITEAQTGISVVAGNGIAGGAGGSITSSGSTTDELTAQANIGGLTIMAGNGSSQNGIAGDGGSISGFTGYVAEGFTAADGTAHAGLTAITAGAGGGGATSTASGHGGSIDTIALSGLSNTTATTSQIITVDAGNAGVAGNAARGRTGGSVTNVTAYNLDAGTIVQHVAAGDGASGVRKGGAGGNVSDIHVGVAGDLTADIGIRSGVAYGYNVGAAGGIFAGTGGQGGAHSGPNGNVTDVSANAISSIVAGKGVPQLCTEVDQIYLNGYLGHLNPTTVDSTGAFTNIDTANLVGSVQSPTAAGASTFKSGDGLIAAAVFTANHNFVPEALLTLNPNGNQMLVDYQQPNPNPLVTVPPAFLG